MDHNLEPILVVEAPVPTPPPRLEHPVVLPEKSEDAHLFPTYMYGQSKKMDANRILVKNDKLKNLDVQIQDKHTSTSLGEKKLVVYRRPKNLLH